MNIQELSFLSTHVRKQILSMTTTAQSGHPTSSLSAVELMVGLLFSGLFHYDIEDPKHPNNDRLLFSKGHATPLFYALWNVAGVISDEELLQYRTFDSALEGHPSTRFAHTIAPTGSLGQGLSIGVGLAINAQYIDQLPYQTFVLLGDSELAEGSNWEAIQLANFYKLKNLIAIVDVNRLGQRGETMVGHDIETYAQRFSAFGWETITLTDGHDLETILHALDRARSCEKPVAIIAQTIKGKGVAHWEDKNNWHSKQLSQTELSTAISALDKAQLALDTKVTLPVSIPKPETLEKKKHPTTFSALSYDSNQKYASKHGSAIGVMDAMSANPDIYVFDAEVSNSTHMELIREQAPDHFFEMFVAEQNMVSVATGVATTGKTTIASSFSAFLTRAYDQARMAQYADVNLKFFGSYAGVSLGKDGFSQMSLEDIAFFRSLQNSTVIQPADAMSARKLAKELINHPGIGYIRTAREPVVNIYTDEDVFTICGSYVLRQSDQDKLTVVASGITVHEALKAYDILQKEGITIRVIDQYSIKPIDPKNLILASQQTQGLIVVEDHSPEGGLAEAIRSILWTERPVIGSLAVRKRPRSGTPAELLAYEEIDAEAICSTVKKMLLC